MFWWRQCWLFLFSKYCCLKEGRYYHSRNGAQGTKVLNFQWKTKEMFGFCWYCLKSDGLTSLEIFVWFLFFFKFCLTLLVTEKLKTWIFETPIIPKTLNINTQGSTSAKSIYLHIVRKLIGYSLQKVLVKAVFTLTVFQMLLFKG